jgi:predicted transcriptional regulator
LAKRRKIITTVYLDPGQLDEIEKIARIDKKNKSLIIREALEEYLEKRRVDYEI